MGRAMRTLALVALSVLLAGQAAAQPKAPTAPATQEVVPPEQSVAVEPVARDEAIDRRITRILEATGWYRGVGVSVDQGVVFLDGVATTADQRSWARDLAARTEDVVAVVNRIEVREAVSWSFAPAFGEIESLARRFFVALPLIVLALLILPVAWWLSGVVAGLVRRLLGRRVESSFLRDVIARAVAIPVFLLGLYIVLQVAGLTGLAVSLLGGAGVIGIVVGFAFRDIAENFLASLLLSIRRPFRADDYIEVDGHEGLVQTMNTRSTILLSPEGNHIQIPNATVFKNTIINYTAAPLRRVVADVGIGYDASVAETQAIIVEVLRGHEAVLADPPPMVLVETLGAATVNLRVYFWTNGQAFSILKVRSACLRLIKRALVEHGISMPDEAREIIFPHGVPLIYPGGAAHAPEAAAETAAPARAATRAESGAEATPAEGGLGNETAKLPKSIADGTIPEADAENLLRDR